MRFYKIYILVLTCFIGLSLNSLLESRNTVHYVAPATEVVEVKSTPKTFDNEIHRLALKYNKSERLAREIIRCEGQLYKEKGNNKNYDKSGNVWSKDVGYWQINDYYHLEEAKRLGFDIFDDWDNLEFGFILWNRDGLRHWSASRSCWGHLLTEKGV